ncbi:MAG: sulfatase-like hydrolase/transferase [Deltaproteobacteria bacterium]|nr:sulfatase-like hydrolase/transferase [Deltaproteobacteria bacterium]
MDSKNLTHSRPYQSFVTAFWFFLLQLTYAFLIKLLNGITLLLDDRFEFWQFNPPLTTPLLLGEEVLISAVFATICFALWGHRITRYLFLATATVGFVFLAFDQLAFKMFFCHVNFNLYRDSHDISRLQSSIIDLMDISFVILLVTGLTCATLMWLKWRPSWVHKLLNRGMARPIHAAVILTSYVGVSYVYAFACDNENLHRTLVVELARTFNENNGMQHWDGIQANWHKSHLVWGTPPPKEDFTRLRENISRVSQKNKLNVVHYIIESTPYRETSLRPDSKYATTPFLEELAKADSGISFGNYHVVFPGSTRSNFTTFSGTYPYLDGESDIERFAHIDVKSISGILKDEGYQTALFASGDTWYDNFDKFLRHLSFDKYYDLNTVPDDIKKAYLEFKWGMPEEIIIDEALDWIATVSQKGKPFSLQYIATYPHHPYKVPKKHRNALEGNWGTDEERYRVKDYRRALRYADESVKRLYKGLEKMGLAKNTLFVVTSDHGEALGLLRKNRRFHAGAVYDENVHIPLVIHNPLLFQGVQQRSNRIGSQIDFLPTLLELLNIEAPKLSGQSLVATKYRHHPLLFSSGEQVGLRDGQFKFIMQKDDAIMSIYDLNNDPDEQNNIVSEHAEKLAAYKRLVYSWQHDMNRFYDNVESSGDAKKIMKEVELGRKRDLRNLETPVRDAVVCPRKDWRSAEPSSRIPTFENGDRFGVKIFWKSPGTYTFIVDVKRRKNDDRVFWKRALQTVEEDATIQKFDFAEFELPLKPGRYDVFITANQKTVTRQFNIRKREIHP